MDNQEVKIPEKYKDIISNIISIEEIQTFLQLQKKMIEVDKAIALAEKDIAEKLNPPSEHTGPVPYYVTLTLMSDVVIPSSDPHQSPEPVEKKSQSYVIEFIDKGYSVLIDRIYEKLTSVITDACKELVPVPQENTHGDSTPEPRAE